VRSTSSAAETAKRKAREVGPWVDLVARIGYLAKGGFYLALGALAFQIAFGGAASSGSGQRRAFVEILQQPFGRTLLILVVIGLLAYASWRLVQATVDPDYEGSDASGTVKRVGYAISGLAHIGYALLGWRVLAGAGGGGGNAESWTARLMNQPFGRWLVIIVGLIVLATGLYQFYRAYSARFMQVMRTGSMNAAARAWARRLGRAGYAARGVIYVLIGGFLAQAGRNANASEAGGLGQSFATLARQPYGPWLLGLVAAGLVAYAVYAGALARYRRIDVG
jgi:hypothetical protein